MNPLLTIGLTGGIGSGKSTAARHLAELGAHVIDADRVGHEIYAPGTEGWDAVVARFGPDIIAADGKIDRKKLGSVVFNDPNALLDLNAIVHPRIGAEVGRRILAYRESAASAPLVIEAALLFEAGWTEFADEVWVVRAPIDEVVRRLCEDRGMSEADARARIATQHSDEQRRAAADVVIDNDGTLEQLRARVSAAWDRARHRKR